jgi:hypothetical protein
MTEERITQVETPEGNTHTSTTIVTDGEPRRSGSGGTWFVLFVVLLAVLVGIWAFTQMGGAEIQKDNAMTEAANSVGAAADKVGDAAQDAGSAVEEAANNAADQASEATSE